MRKGFIFSLSIFFVMSLFFYSYYSYYNTYYQVSDNSLFYELDNLDAQFFSVERSIGVLLPLTFDKEAANEGVLSFYTTFPIENHIDEYLSFVNSSSKYSFSYTQNDIKYITNKDLNITVEETSLTNFGNLDNVSSIHLAFFYKSEPLPIRKTLCYEGRPVRVTIDVLGIYGENRSYVYDIGLDCLSTFRVRYAPSPYKTIYVRLNRDSLNVSLQNSFDVFYNQDIHFNSNEKVNIYVKPLYLIAWDADVYKAGEVVINVTED